MGITLCLMMTSQQHKLLIPISAYTGPTVRNVISMVYVPWIWLQFLCIVDGIPDSKVHGVNMGPTWALSAPDGPHVGPMNLAIRDGLVPGVGFVSIWSHMAMCQFLVKGLVIILLLYQHALKDFEEHICVYVCSFNRICWPYAKMLNQHNTARSYQHTKFTQLSYQTHSHCRHTCGSSPQRDDFVMKYHYNIPFKMIPFGKSTFPHHLCAWRHFSSVVTNDTSCRMIPLKWRQNEVKALNRTGYLAQPMELNGVSLYSEVNHCCDYAREFVSS